jgi:hypothetical protein
MSKLKVNIEDSHGNCHDYEVISGDGLEFITLSGELADKKGFNVSSTLPYRILKLNSHVYGFTVTENYDPDVDDGNEITVEDKNQYYLGKFSQGSVYYAHCLALYDTEQENRDMELLSNLFNWNVYNPNDPTKEPVNKFLSLKPRYGYDEAFDSVWGDLVKRSSLLAFRALPDGSIPKGVAREIEIAVANNIPVIELPNGLIRRSLNVEETREYLRDVGHR